LNIQVKIIDILKSNFKWLVDENIKMKSTIREDLQLDSISIINFQVLIEDEFDIIFNPMETDLVEVFTTISSLYKYVKMELDE